MSERPNTDDLDLTDAELVTVLKNHGIDRRSLMKAVGVGAGVAALGGTAAGARGGDARIDEAFGASYSADESPPRGLVDHTVELRGPPESGPQTDVHPGFPLMDTPEDGDFDPDTETAEFYFDPVGLHVDPGDVVAFEVVEHHEHTATAFAEKFHLPSRIPDVPGFSSPPVVGSETWIYRFDAAGTYDLVCLPHLPFGMVMRVVAGDGGTDYGALPNPPGPTDPFANASAILTAPELDPDNVVTEGTVAWGDLSL